MKQLWAVKSLVFDTVFTGIESESKAYGFLGFLSNSAGFRLTKRSAKAAGANGLSAIIFCSESCLAMAKASVARTNHPKTVKTMSILISKVLLLR